MNNNWFVAATTIMMVVWRMTPSLFDQRRQRSSAASAAQSVARFVTVPKNPIGFSEISEKVGDREAADAAERAEAADEQQLVCRGDDNHDGGLPHDFTLFDQRRQPISGISGPQV